MNTEPSRQDTNLTLKVNHQDLMWTGMCLWRRLHPLTATSVIAFDAQVLSWSLDSNPSTRVFEALRQAGIILRVSSYDLTLEVVLPRG